MTESDSSFAQNGGPEYDQGMMFGSPSGGDAMQAASSQMGFSEAASANTSERKIFVGGIPLDTTHEELSEYFNQFGTVSDVIVKVDPMTGRPRGFGFVVFATQEDMDKAMNAPKPHSIKGKYVDVKRAVGAKSASGNRKIYIGGLTDDVTEDDITETLAPYGKIELFERPKDRSTGQFRNFCFATLDNVEGVNQVMKDGHITIKGSECYVRPARPPGFGWGGSFGRGYGFGYGGYGFGGGGGGGGAGGGYGYGYDPSYGYGYDPSTYYHGYGGYGQGSYGYGQGYDYYAGYGNEFSHGGGATGGSGGGDDGGDDGSATATST